MFPMFVVCPEKKTLTPYWDAAKPSVIEKSQLPRPLCVTLRKIFIIPVCSIKIVEKKCIDVGAINSSKDAIDHPSLEYLWNWFRD